MESIEGGFQWIRMRMNEYPMFHPKPWNGLELYATPERRNRDEYRPFQ
jgi:hypothetical protein